MKLLHENTPLIFIRTQLSSFKLILHIKHDSSVCHKVQDLFLPCEEAQIICLVNHVTTDYVCGGYSCCLCWNSELI